MADKFLAKFLEKLLECFEEIKKTISSTDESVIERVFDYTKNNHPVLLQDIGKAWEGILQTWGNDFESFEKHLIEFYKLHIRMINRCKNNI